MYLFYKGEAVQQKLLQYNAFFQSLRQFLLVLRQDGWHAPSDWIQPYQAVPEAQDSSTWNTQRGGKPVSSTTLGRSVLECQQHQPRAAEAGGDPWRWSQGLGNDHAKLEQGPSSACSRVWCLQGWTLHSTTFLDNDNSRAWATRARAASRPPKDRSGAITQGCTGTPRSPDGRVLTAESPVGLSPGEQGPHACRGCDGPADGQTSIGSRERRLRGRSNEAGRHHEGLLLCSGPCQTEHKWAGNIFPLTNGSTTHRDSQTDKGPAQKNNDRLFSPWYGNSEKTINLQTQRLSQFTIQLSKLVAPCYANTWNVLSWEFKQ